MIKVDNVDKEYERITDLNMNINIVKAPKSYSWGSRSFWIKDPDGNIVDFLSDIENSKGV